MFDVGWSELLVIGVVALIVVGPKDLPVMFHTLGRFTAKARSMAREFTRAMDDAARESGLNEVSRDLKAATSAKGLGLDKLKEAAGKFETWDPLKKPAPGNKAATIKPNVTAEPKPTPAEAVSSAATATATTTGTQPPEPATPADPAPAPVRKARAARKPAAPATGDSGPTPAVDADGAVAKPARPRSPRRKTASGDAPSGTAAPAVAKAGAPAADVASPSSGDA